MHWVTLSGNATAIRLIRSRLRIQPGANNDANNMNLLYMATLKVVLLKLYDVPMKNLRLQEISQDTQDANVLDLAAQNNFVEGMKYAINFGN
ncbi:hypothetical protein [Coxiella-like endosymbiont of Rhipicephalus sanguineus]|uniref:hypothetical protein n=1 Tax=Coxiella-like endosymbiont of Rhipicephalus sanguineus TaxID=1955402 RepID=UPI002040A2C8|nr:hypothetical protein [Coxiella-like endosymbiont of Rhipicephalus sanguineus]